MSTAEKIRSRREEALFAINVEAAKEIARQLRLRNISGMILVDFINLKKKEQQQKLISVIREELQKDSVPANFIDITRLGLVELTRKKMYTNLCVKFYHKQLDEQVVMCYYTLVCRTVR